MYRVELKAVDILGLISYTSDDPKSTVFSCPSPGVLPIVAYTRRFRPKGVPFSGFRYMQGLGIYFLKYMNGYGNLSYESVKRLKWPNG